MRLRYWLLHIPLSLPQYHVVLLCCPVIREVLGKEVGKDGRARLVKEGKRGELDRRRVCPSLAWKVAKAKRIQEVVV